MVGLTREHRARKYNTEPVQAVEPVVEQTEDFVPKSNRRRRANLSEFKQKLSAPQRKGYVRRWVNDDPGRIEELQERGYTFVEDGSIAKDGVGSRVQRYVGTRDGGHERRAYLMETPDEYYAEDQADKQKEIKAFEDRLRAGQDTQGQLAGEGLKTYDAGSSLNRTQRRP